jgi:hypothetical protein
MLSVSMSAVREPCTAKRRLTTPHSHSPIGLGFGCNPCQFAGTWIAILTSFVPVIAFLCTETAARVSNSRAINAPSCLQSSTFEGSCRATLSSESMWRCLAAPLAR